MELNICELQQKVNTFSCVWLQTLSNVFLSESQENISVLIFVLIVLVTIKLEKCVYFKKYFFI
jgi:hypothetical protein